MKKRTMKRLLGVFISFSLLLQPMVSSVNQFGIGNVASAQDNKIEVTTDDDAANKEYSSSNEITVSDDKEKTESTLLGSDRANDSPSVNEKETNVYIAGIDGETLTSDILKAKVRTPDDVDFDDPASIRAALGNKDFPFKPDSEWMDFYRSQDFQTRQNWENLDREGAKWYRDYYIWRLEILSHLVSPEYDGGSYTTSIVKEPLFAQYNNVYNWDGYTDRIGNTIPTASKPGSEISWLLVGGGLVWCIEPQKPLNSKRTVTGRRNLDSIIGSKAKNDIAKIIYVAQGKKAGVSLGARGIPFITYQASQLLIWGYMRQGADLGELQPDLTISDVYDGFVDNLNVEIDRIRAEVEKLDQDLVNVWGTLTVRPGETMYIPLNTYDSLNLESSGIVASVTQQGNQLAVKIKERSELGGLMQGRITLKAPSYGAPVIEHYEPKVRGEQTTTWLAEWGDPRMSEIDLVLQPDPRGGVDLSKTDSETGQPVSYAKFNITGPNGYNQDVVVNGGRLQLNDLVAGTYTIREIDVVEDYVLDGTEKTFTVTENGSVNLDIKNTKVKGALKVYKQDSLLKAGIKDVKFNLTKNGEAPISKTTDADGNITFGNLTVGTYTLKEETPAGYVENPKTYTVKVTRENLNDKTATVKVFDGNQELTLDNGVLTIDNTPVRGNIKIIKKGSGNWLTNVLESFFLEGAEFGVYNAKGEEVAKAKTNAQGVVEFKDLPGGKYTIKETFVPVGYQKVEDFEVTIAEAGKTVTVEKVDEVRKGKLRVVKIDKENNKPINFAGAQFKVKNLQTNKFVEEDGKDVFETNASGEFTTKLDLLYGKYELHEVKAPEGYLLDTTPIAFTVTGENTVVAVNFADVRVKGKVTVNKTGAVATTATKAAGSYGDEYTISMSQEKALEGVEFDVVAKEDVVLKTGDVVKKAGEVVGKLTTDAQGVGVLDNLEIGKYTLKETKAPAGYVFAKDIDFEISYEGETKAIVTKDTKVENDYRQVKLILDKEEQKQVGLDVSGNKEHGTPKYEMVAGANKVFVVRAKDGIRNAVGQEIVPAAGIVATLTTDANGHVDKTLVLPDGKYTVQEVQTTPGLILDEVVREFTVESQGNDAILEVNLAKVTLGKDKFTNNLKPVELKTTATNKDDGSKIVGAMENVTIVDKVEYKNLIVDGRTYTVSGKLMVKETGQPLLVDGKEVTATKTFVPEVSNGSVDLEFTFNASALGGNKVVAFEDLHQDGIHVGTHSDINDDGQTVEIPNFKLQTTATNKDDGSKVFDPKERVTLNDRVEYVGAVKGKEYTVEGVLVDTEGQPILEDGKEIKSSVTFTATDTNGHVDVVFTFNAKSLRGKDVVVFEKGYVNVGGKLQLVGKHEDPKDKGQTVTVLDPKIETMASFNGRKVEDHLGQVTLRDVVKATNVVVGRSYDLTADLMDAETTQPIVDKDGNNVTTKVSFTVGQGETFIVNEVPELEQGQMFVVRDGKLIIVDEEGTQVKEVPVVDPSTLSVGTAVTMFTYADLNYDASLLENRLSETENLTYDEALANKSTDLLGLGEIHVDKGGNVTTVGGDKAILDDLVKGIFNPSDKELEELARQYKVKSKKTVVVYEGLSIDGDEIAFHRDPKDTDQQGHHNNIKLRTTFMDVKTGSHIVEDGGTVDLVDKVALYNVINGNEYEVTGVIHDRNTGQPVVQEDGTPYTSTVKVKVDVTGAKQGEIVNSTVDIPFTVKMSDIKTSHIVAFEEIKRSGDVTVLAIHRDVNDKYQTIEVKKPEVGTKFADVSGSQEILPMSKVKVIDHVELKNVKNGSKYDVTGTIMDKETGEQLKDANGKPYETTVTVEVKDDTKPVGAFVNTVVDVEFEIDASKVAGKEIVAFEELRKHGDLEVIGSHKDINDGDQTIKVKKPELKTKATVGGKKEVTAGGTVIIEDTISYKGLKTGVKYKFKGKLMNAKTQKPLVVDGKEVVAGTEVVPTTEDGIATVKFEFNSAGMDTTKIVVFEEALAYNELTKGWDKVGSHEDFKDLDQTVDVVKPGEKPLPNTSVSDLFEDYSGYALIVLVVFGLGIVVIRRRKVEE